jgi:hypothetical protein
MYHMNTTNASVKGPSTVERKMRRPLKTRLGGEISVRGRVVESEQELERALAAAFAGRGYRLTDKGEGYVEAMRELGAA